jgi:CIC family chloride channel protein
MDMRRALRLALIAGMRTRAAFLRNGPAAVQFWLIALLVGIAAGYAAIGFRLAISSLQTLIYGVDDVHLHTRIEELSWVIVIGVPILGGLAVGLILHFFTPDGKAASVSHVIEAAALHGGRGPIGSGLASAAASIITLSTGGSTGREGPVVHLASLIASWVSTRMNANAITGRDLLGCAVASAVSASFNAPIAGALFALEVILRHFALHAFAPIVIASVAGASISRLHMGNVTEFRLPAHNLAFYQELPAFLMLGLVCGLAAVVMMRAIFVAEALGDRVQGWTRMPGWLRPAAAGALLGAIAIWFPHIIGVGYETTTLALTSGIGLQDAIVFAVIKVIAVAITFAGRMGGGIFSPSLMLGALTGLAFGTMAIEIFPSVSGSETLYALAGMGAAGAAVLGAPVSTIMIIFELTGDWQAGIAVMASVSIATVVAASMVDRSFFLTQLERRGVHLAVGAQAWIPGTIPLRDVMRVRGADGGASDSACWALVEQGAMLTRDDSLQEALPMFDRLKSGMIPVVERGAPGAPPGAPPELIGAVFHVDALKAFNRALLETHREEHS